MDCQEDKLCGCFYASLHSITITIIIVYVRDSIVLGRIERPMLVFSFLKVKLSLTLPHAE